MFWLEKNYMVLFRGIFFHSIAFLFVFGLIFQSHRAIGQTKSTGEVTGVVYDATSREPLQDANIYLVQLNIGTTSDQDGSFSIKNIPNGTYHLKITYLGYKNHEQKITVDKKMVPDLEIYLKSQTFYKDEVVISANRNKKELEQPFRIDIIPVRKIEQAPVINVPGILDYVSGVNMNNTFGIFSSRAFVTMRGLPANDQSRTLILLDGIPLNKSDQGSVNWNMINKNNIESIKVIKGPGPAQYGSGAMGGVIDLTTKKPVKKITGEAIVGYGTYNTYEANIDLSGTTTDSLRPSGIYWNLVGFGRKSDGYITEPDEFYEEEDTILVPTFLQEINTTAKLGYVFKNRQNLEIRFGYYDDKRGNGVKVFENYGAFSEHDTYRGALLYSGNTGTLSWNANFFYLFENYERIYEYMNEGEYQLYMADSKRGDLGGALNLSWTKFKNQNLSFGIDYKLGSVDGKDTYYTSTDIISNAGKIQTGAFYLQDEIWLLNRKLQVNIGLRYDFAKYFDGLFAVDYPSYSIEFIDEFENRSMPNRSWNAFCPRFSVQYKFSESARTFISAARGFRAPILDDMTRTGKRSGTFRIANPDLKPELINSYEWGADGEIFRNLILGGSLYYSIGEDFMYYSSTGDSVNMGYKIVPILKMKNISKVEIYGLEIETKYTFDPHISAFANYSYTHATILENEIYDPLVDYDLEGNYLTDIPDHKITTGITWINPIVNTTLLYKYIGEQWINDLNVVDDEYLMTDKYPAYSVFSLRLEKEILKHFKLAVNIENVFDKIYTDSRAQKCPGRFIMVYLNFRI